MKSLVTAAIILTSNPGDTITTKENHPQEIVNVLNENSEIQTLTNAIATLKTREDLPLHIDYGSKNIDLPRFLDLKRNKEKPEHLFIRLDDRIFFIKPIVGTVTDIQLKNGTISIEIEGFLSKEFNPQKLADLIRKIQENATGVGSSFRLRGVIVTEFELPKDESNNKNKEIQVNK